MADSILYMHVVVRVSLDHSLAWVTQHLRRQRLYTLESLALVSIGFRLSYRSILSSNLFFQYSSEIVLQIKLQTSTLLCDYAQLWQLYSTHRWWDIIDAVFTTGQCCRHIRLSWIEWIAKPLEDLARLGTARDLANATVRLSSVMALNVRSSLGKSNLRYVCSHCGNHSQLLRTIWTTAVGTVCQQKPFKQWQDNWDCEVPLILLSWWCL